MFRHIEELIERNEKLTEENAAMRSENRSLRKRVKNLEMNFDARLEALVAKSVKAATAPLLSRIETLEKKIVQKDAEIARLKGRLGKDSNNSSKPPGSDGLSKGINNREKNTGRKSGGQPGHTGRTLTIPDNLSELVTQGKAEHVVIDETQGSAKYTSDWTIDIKIVPVFTETRRRMGALPRIAYGSSIGVLSVYLQHVGMLSLERLSAFFSDVTDGVLHISEATLIKHSRIAANAIDLSEAEQWLLDGAVLHTDETPVRVGQRYCAEDPMTLERRKNGAYMAYIRTYSNKTTTVLMPASHKSIKSVEADDILPRYHGILSHDHEAKFYRYGDAHATCAAHLTRELRGMEELCKIALAGKIRRLFLDMNDYKIAKMAKGEICPEEIVLRGFEAQYDAFVQEGLLLLAKMKRNELGLRELRNMMKRLAQHKDSYLLFIRDFTAPFTNNQAERDLRHVKTKQKISGCFRSWQGVVDYCKIRSLLDTVRKRGLDLFHSLSLCFASGG